MPYPKRLYRVHPVLGHFQSTLVAAEHYEKQLEAEDPGWSETMPAGFVEGHTPEQAAAMPVAQGVALASVATVTAPTRMN